jgi:endoglucanase
MYNITGRDAGGYSAGGAATLTAYLDFVKIYSAIFGQTGANIYLVLEPDALSQLDLISNQSDQTARLNAVKQATIELKKNANVKVYQDAGHDNWVPDTTMAQRLTAAGIALADGFALNSSNNRPVPGCIDYGNRVSALTAGKHYVIDTGRAGQNYGGDWCNPPDRKLGPEPTLSTGVALCDAYLWTKVIGESDGYCNGGPAAGEWYPSYCIDILRRTWALAA